MSCSFGAQAVFRVVWLKTHHSKWNEQMLFSHQFKGCGGGDVIALCVRVVCVCMMRRGVMCLWDCCLMSGGMALLSLQPHQSTANHGWWAALLNTLKTSLLTVNTIGFQGVKLPEKELKYYISSASLTEPAAIHSLISLHTL